jgi:phosphoserine phosphatase RsbU/P
LDANTLCIAVGDVSDKGMPAALFMARARSLLRAATLQFSATTGQHPGPADIATVMNVELCKNNPICMFITLFFGFLDLTTGILSYVNAGHVRPFLLRAGQPAAELACANGPPLGIMETARYRNGELTIAPGDGMVIISDGVPDMLDGAGDDYGLVRLLDDLHELGHLPAAPLTASLVERIYQFSGDMAQTDDVTILTVRRPV